MEKKRPNLRPKTALPSVPTSSPRKKPSVVSEGNAQNNNEIRPKTESSLALKKWRMANLHSNGTASRREVELLGEWLNSVLADNVEMTGNPLDVVTNAQHWYSIAFNELVRQVSVSSAERSRLFAVIWKRNQDLFSKMIQLQRKEREYILTRHKERVQFLKTDLDFCKSRLNTIETAYNEEKQRWNESHERDISKFDSFQEKINQQIEERCILEKELTELQKRLGIYQERRDIDDDYQRAYSYQEDSMIWKLRNLESRIKNSEKILPKQVSSVIDDINHYFSFQHQSKSHEIRSKFEYLFMCLPDGYKPQLKTKNWMNSAISFIYSNYSSSLGKGSPNKMRNNHFPDLVYLYFINLFGSRQKTEQVLFDLLHTSMHFYNDSSSRASLFLRFFGLFDPVPHHVLHFYLFILCSIRKNNPGKMFPEIEAGEDMIAGIPLNIASQSTSGILQRLVKGRLLKFYTERIDKIALGGSLRFGGRAIAELDSILEYLITAYLEEVHRIEDSLKEMWDKLPSHQINTYDDFHQMTTILVAPVDNALKSKLMNECRINSKGDQFDFPVFIKLLNDHGLTSPIVLEKNDFDSDLFVEDLIPFIQQEVESIRELYNKTIEIATTKDDDVVIKQLRSSRAKLEQTLTGRSASKIFENNVREYFERLALISGVF